MVKPKAPRQWNSTIPQRKTWLAKGTKPIPEINTERAKKRQARYSKHLRTKAFRAVRLKRFQLDDYRCYLCGEQFEIQDLTFDHDGYNNVGHETVEDGKTACKWCHRCKDNAKVVRAMAIQRRKG